MLKRKCKITFISHGSTVHTQEGIFSDAEKYPPLTGRGQEEIMNVCKYIKKRGIKNNKLFTSPSVSCIQTSQIISDVFKQDFEVLKSLYPRKCGNLSGKSFDKVIKPNSENPPFDCLNINEGESLEDFNKRVETVIKSLVAENIGNRLLIVTYPYVIQSVIAYILGLSPENQAKILIKTGSLTQISCFDTWSSLIYSGYVPLY